MNGAMLHKNLFCSHLINANPKTKEQNEQSLSAADAAASAFPACSLLPSMTHTSLSLSSSHRSQASKHSCDVRMMAADLLSHAMEIWSGAKKSVILSQGVSSLEEGARSEKETTKKKGEK
jgi:hypothetical protein